MKTVPLTKGFSALVDDEDYERVIAFKWISFEDTRRDGSIKAVYAIRSKDGLRLHRFILNETNPKIFVDHEDHNGLNCQKYNLRRCSNQQNLGNARKTIRPTTSKYKGVCRNRGDKKWAAYITIEKKCKTLGYFSSEVEAARAYDRAAVEVFGPFALLNNP